MRRFSLRAVLAFALALVLGIGIMGLPRSGEAAGDQDHDHSTMVGPHGGQVAAIGPFDTEIVMKDGAINVYLFTHDGADHTEKASGGNVIFIVGGGSKRVALKPGSLGLSGKYDFPATKDMKAVLRIKMSDGKTHNGKAVLNEQ